MPDNQWAFILSDTSGLQLADLIDAHGVKTTFRLTDQCEATFALSGFSPRAPLITELATDLTVVCNGQRLTRMRIGGSQETLGGTDDAITASAVDYRGVLARRYVQTAKTYTATDMSAIAWDLITTSQNYSVGGDLGIRPGNLATVAPVTFVAASGKKISEALDDLAVMYPGLNYEIDGNLRLNTWGFRGISRSDVVLHYGVNVIALTRTVDTTEYANAVRASGADGVATSFQAVADLATRPEKRIEAQVGNTDIKDAAGVVAVGQQYLTNRGTLLPTYTMTLTPHWWSPDVLWLGDYARIRIRSGRLDISSIERVFQIDVTLDDAGGEQVDITFGHLRQDLITLLRKIPARIEAINRR